jgi:hypothetical protein
LPIKQQEVILKYHLNKRWYYLYGEARNPPHSALALAHSQRQQQQQQQLLPRPTRTHPTFDHPSKNHPTDRASPPPAGALCLAAYLYLLPFIRRGLGSAHK